MQTTECPNCVIEVQNLTKVYKMGEIEVHALRGVSFKIFKGEVISIMGPSGSGKSTLMNTLGCLDRPTAGAYFLDGELVSRMNDDQLASVRNRKVGFVFQSFNLLPRMTALANVDLPLRYAGQRKGRLDIARQSLEAVGLADEVVDLSFRGVASRIQGARFVDIESEQKLLAQEAWSNRKPIQQGGLLKFVYGGEYHAYNPDVVNTLQAAVQQGSYETYKIGRASCRERV